jgi:PAS domain S-box-containing protein
MAGAHEEVMRPETPSLAEAEAMLQELANVFLSTPASARPPHDPVPDIQARYQTLVEQIPAVVFVVYFDRGIGEAYVSPQIEATLGFTRAEWLDDPVRWYRQIHPEDNMRWSLEAAEMFLTGKPLHSVYRVIGRDGRVVWFQCDAKMVRREDGQPWFIQGSAFDISEIKRAEAAVEEGRNFVSAILNTVSTLIIVVDLEGRVAQLNQACAQLSPHPPGEVTGRHLWDLFPADDGGRFRNIFEQLLAGGQAASFETRWTARDGGSRLICWSGAVLRGARGKPRHVILTGIDITESDRLKTAILDISARVERRIGQDLHDGLGQHLTGIAFMSKVLQQKLADQSEADAAAAGKIVSLVNQAINKTRELSRGLLPVVSDTRGLMSALEHLAREVEDLFGITCRFECAQPVLIYQDAVATHLYHIAQEAVNNALKHGRARQILIRLGFDEGRILLRIEDNGVGIPDDRGRGQGMGLHIMNCRARMVGGALEIRRRPEGGTAVACSVPAPAAHPGDER